MKQKLKHTNLSQKCKLGKQTGLTRILKEGIRNKNRCDFQRKEGFMKFFYGGGLSKIVGHHGWQKTKNK